MESIPFASSVLGLKKLVLASFVLVLSACAPNPYTAKPGIQPRPSVTSSVPVPAPARREPPIVRDVVPVEQNRVVIEDRVNPLPEERQIAANTLPPAIIVSPVVQNLVKKSQAQSGQGDFDNAANSLERALRIEPRNAMLWNRLADVRYLQSLWNKSIQLAAKSNTLAGTNRELRRENWYLISNSYKALGNTEAEKKYRDKLIYNGN